MKRIISASVLSADMLNLEKEVKRIEKSEIEMLHFDVMDGVFVNNITYGLPILSAIRKITNLTLDVHLMITEPHKYIRQFAECGADIISFHAESKSDIIKTVEEIKKYKVKAAVAVKPNTPIEEIYSILPYLDMVLIMTVEPGFGGQSFIPETVDKIKKLRCEINRLGLKTDIQVDGGIDFETANIVKSAGANIIVSGSFLFKSENMALTAFKLREEIKC